MHVQGHCHCGAIRYEAEVDPEKVTICHCTDCQSLTGSAYRVTVAAPAGGFRLLQGEPRVYVKTTADSGNPRGQAFCPQCGSPLYTFAADQPQPASYGLRVGCLVQRAELPPRKQIWCDSALGWTENLAGLPRRARD